MIHKIDSPPVQAPLRVIDFFCGAGGMSCGLQAAGFNVLGGVDIDPECGLTYSANIPGARFIEADVSIMHPSELEATLGVDRNDPSLVLVGCSPCQFYSQIRTNKTSSLGSSLLLLEFQRFIEYFRPGFVIIENVPRLKKEAVIDQFKGDLEQMGYVFADGILNASGYGVPQNRMRYVLIASSVGCAVSMPIPDFGAPPTVEEFIGRENGFAAIVAGHTDPTELQHTSAALSESNLLRIAMTPPDGGDRSAWADHPRLQIDAYRNRSEIFRDTYGRMAWERPAPTITTKFLSLSNGRFGHPTEARAISVREGATLQTFPKTFRFHANTLHGLARQIGNAVPPALAHRIGLHLYHLAYPSSNLEMPYPGTHSIVDGRARRAKATFESVHAACKTLIDSGRATTSTNVLAITGGSKQSVLKQLKAVRLEKLRSEAKRPSVEPTHMGLGIEELMLALESGRTPGIDRKITKSLRSTHHPLLNDAIASGYIGLIITQQGIDRLNSKVGQTPHAPKLWGRRKLA